MNVVMTGAGPVRRGAGHRRGRAVLARASSTTCSGWPSAGSRRSSRSSARCWPSRRRDASDRPRREVRPRDRQPRQGRARSRASSRDAGRRRRARAPARRRARGRRDRRHARGQRPAQGGRAVRGDRACPRSPTTPGSRSTRSAARPACTRPGSRRRRHLRRQRRASCSSALARRADAEPAPRASPPWRSPAGPTAGRWPPSATSRARSPTEPRGDGGFGYDPVFVPDGGRRPHLRRDAAGREARDLAPGPRVPYPGRRPASRRGPGGAAVADGSHRHRRVRGRSQGPRGRARVPRPRRAPLRRELLAAPELGGRPPPRGGVRGPGRPLPLARDRPAGAARLRGRGDRAGRRRGPARRVPLPAQLHLGAAAAARTAPTCSCSPPSWRGGGGPDLPLEVSAIDSIPEATDAPERSLRIVAHQSVSLLHIRDGDAVSCEVLDRCLDVSRYLLERAGDWLG